MKNKKNLHTQTGAWINIFAIANNEEYEKFGLIFFPVVKLFGLFYSYISFFSCIHEILEWSHLCWNLSHIHFPLIFHFKATPWILPLFCLSCMYRKELFQFCFSLDQFYTNFWNLESCCQMDLLSPEQFSRCSLRKCMVRADYQSTSLQAILLPYILGQCLRVKSGQYLFNVFPWREIRAGK